MLSRTFLRALQLCNEWQHDERASTRPAVTEICLGNVRKFPAVENLSAAYPVVHIFS